jgi:hypothetical protein
MSASIHSHLTPCSHPVVHSPSCISILVGQVPFIRGPFAICSPAAVGCSSPSFFLLEASLLICFCHAQIGRHPREKWLCLCQLRLPRVSSLPCSLTLSWEPFVSQAPWNQRILHVAFLCLGEDLASHPGSPGMQQVFSKLWIWAFWYPSLRGCPHCCWFCFFSRTGHTWVLPAEPGSGCTVHGPGCCERRRVLIMRKAGTIGTLLNTNKTTTWCSYSTQSI